MRRRPYGGPRAWNFAVTRCDRPAAEPVRVVVVKMRRERARDQLRREGGECMRPRSGTGHKGGNGEQQCGEHRDPNALLWELDADTRDAMPVALNRF